MVYTLTQGVEGSCLSAEDIVVRANRLEDFQGKFNLSVI